MGFYKESDLKETQLGKIPSDWQVVRFKDIFEETELRAGQTEPHEKPLVLSLTKNHGLIPQKSRFHKKVAIDDLSNYKVLKKGWLVYNPYVIWEGAVFFLKDLDVGLVSPVYVTWRVRTEADYVFLDYLMRTRRMLNEFLRLSTGAVQRRRALV